MKTPESGRASEPEAKKTSKRSPTAGLRSRLVAITLVPMMGISTWAALSTNSRLQQSHKAEIVEKRINSLGMYLEARIALDAERLPTQSKLAVEAFGVPSAFGAMVLGFNPDSRLAEVRPLTDAAFGGELAEFKDDLAALRKSVAGPGKTGGAKESLQSGRFSEALEGFDTIEEQLRVRSTMELVRIDEVLGGFDGARQLWRSVEVLLASQELANESGFQTSLMFEVQSGADERRDSRRRLAASEWAANSKVELIRGQAGPATQRALRAYETNPSTVESAKTIESVLLTAPKPLVSNAADFGALQETAVRFTTVLKRAELARGILATALAETRSEAVSAERSAKKLLVLTISLAAALALVSLLIALAFARSISRPLRALARRADRIGHGELEGERLAESGPREVVQVNRAVNELVANLLVLDRQASALAAGELNAPVFDEMLPGALGTSMRETVGRLRNSIQNREELQTQLSHQATHDDLTGLPNRKSLMEAIGAALARGKRNQTGVALLFIDLDGFKRANDAHGHRFGDQVLSLCAQRLVNELRTGDFVARIGGDEFVVISEHITDPIETINIANRYIATLSQPVTIDNKATNIGASVGIAIDFDGTATEAMLLRDADIAVYRAKATGRGHAEIFDLALRTEMEKRADVEQAIQFAINNDELRLEYQPIVNVARVDSNGEPRTRISSVEALIRWDRSGVGLVSPADFIPLLETSPRIVDLGAWVMRTGMTQAASWPDGAANLSISLNVSTRHLVAASFVDDVRDALEISKIMPSRVVLEITETSLVDNVAVAIEHLKAVRAMGVRIALDDFGTGFTSIRQLSDFPVDILKIDRSFIVGIGDTGERSIVEMMVGVGRTLGMLTVAEGVETSEQAVLLADMGCATHQGYFHHRPMRPEAFLQRVAEMDAIEATHESALANK
jgi:diguanylate cyclase (GGDEF)-like protein